MTISPAISHTMQPGVPLPKALFEASLSCMVDPYKIIPKEEVDALFQFFKQCPLFRWSDAQNDCEDRAHAICLLLDSWKVPNYKVWVFSGAFLKKTSGQLVNLWNYHVAAALPVWENGHVEIYVIDPSTLAAATTLHFWADTVTDDECSYYLVRNNDDYIFHQPDIKNDNWYKSDSQNFKWMVQGLAGVNGVTSKGKAQLVFNKKKIKQAEKRFKHLLKQPPFSRSIAAF